MVDHWEFWIAGLVAGAGLIYLIAYEWFLWRSTRRWAQHIYGPPDTARLDGEWARPNRRR